MRHDTPSAPQPSDFPHCPMSVQEKKLLDGAENGDAKGEANAAAKGSSETAQMMDRGGEKKDDVTFSQGISKVRRSPRIASHRTASHRATLCSTSRHVTSRPPRLPPDSSHHATYQPRPTSPPLARSSLRATCGQCMPTCRPASSLLPWASTISSTLCSSLPTTTTRWVLHVPVHTHVPISFTLWCTWYPIMGYFVIPWVYYGVWCMVYGVWYMRHPSR